MQSANHSKFHSLHVWSVQAAIWQAIEHLPWIVHCYFLRWKNKNRRLSECLRAPEVFLNNVYWVYVCTLYAIVYVCSACTSWPYLGNFKMAPLSVECQMTMYMYGLHKLGNANSLPSITTTVCVIHTVYVACACTCVFSVSSQFAYW